MRKDQFHSLKSVARCQFFGIDTHSHTDEIFIQMIELGQKKYILQYAYALKYSRYADQPADAHSPISHMFFDA